MWADNEVWRVVIREKWEESPGPWATENLSGFDVCT